MHAPRCLVFDLASLGSLNRFFKDESRRKKLHWTTRISIAHDISKALIFLHQGDYTHACFHGDIKSANICLKKDFTALLIDCGVASYAPYYDSELTTNLMHTSGIGDKGTPGYICPTYAENLALERTQTYTGAMDVYSFGIVLVELFTGMLQYNKVGQEVVNFFDRYSQDGRMQKDLSHNADINAGKWQKYQFHKFLGLALECIRKDPYLRPSATDIEGCLSTLESSAKPWTPGKKNSMVFLFSDPLVWKDTSDGSMHTTPRLDIERERSLIKRCVENSRRDIKLSFDAATCTRLEELASSRVGCLHFSGHGTACSKLIFEDGYSGCDFLDPSSLQKLMPFSEPFKFVFVVRMIIWLC